jgi:hypothetical protein
VVKDVAHFKTETFFKIAPIASESLFDQVAGLCYAAESGTLLLPAPVNPESRAIGEQGEKITFDAELYSVITLTGGKYGTEYIHRFRDIPFGNELFWRTTSRKYNKGLYSISAKVKHHETHSNVIQTRLTHCKLTLKETDNGS